MPTIKEALKELYIDAKNIIPMDSHEMSQHMLYQFIMKDEPYVIKIFNENDRMNKERMAYNVTARMRIPSASVYAFGTLAGGNDYLILTKVVGEAADTYQFQSREEALEFYEEAGKFLARFHDGIHLTKIAQEMEMAWGKCPSVIKDAQGEFLTNDKYKARFTQSVKQDMEQLCGLLIEKETKEAKEIIKAAYETFLKKSESLSFEDIHFGFCHNKYNEHNLIALKGKLTGVIDFELAGFGNTERDICSIYRRTLKADEALEQAFFRGYEQQKNIFPGFKQRLELYLIAECFCNCTRAYQQSPDFFEKNIALLKNITVLS
ncbi:aminoglycoside phosphotransferase family protein [Lachnospiraceae bacterium ZAX-1]